MGKEYFKRPATLPGFDERGSYGERVDLETGSTGADFATNGITLFGSTAAKTYDIGAPAQGIQKYLFCTAGTTAAIQKVRASSGGAIDFLTSAGGREVIQFRANNSAAVLVGRNSSQWMLLNFTGNIAFSTA